MTYISFLTGMCTDNNISHPNVSNDLFTITHGYNYTHRTTKLLGGGDILVSLHPPVCSSVHPASRVRSVAPTVLVGSISYLYILSSDFWRCVACNFFLQNLNFWQFLKICNLDFVLFWLGIWCALLVWVIMGWRGYLRTQAFYLF